MSKDLWHADWSRKTTIYLPGSRLPALSPELQPPTKHRTRDCQTETGNSGTQTDETQETEGEEMGPMTGETGN